MGELNEAERKVLAFLTDRASLYDGGFYGFAGIAEEVPLDRKQIRRACRSLARKGLAKYERGLWTDDGRPGGSGYGATAAGVQYMLPRPDQPQAEVR